MGMQLLVVGMYSEKDWTRCREGCRGTVGGKGENLHFFYTTVTGRVARYFNGLCHWWCKIPAIHSGLATLIEPTLSLIPLFYTWRL